MLTVTSSGAGFLIPGDGDPLPGLHDGQSRRADEKLRKQMLGKNAKRPVHGLTNNRPTTKAVDANVNAPTTPIPRTGDRGVESDEEYGRSALGKTKRNKIMPTTVVE